MSEKVTVNSERVIERVIENRIKSELKRTEKVSENNMKVTENGLIELRS